MKERINRKSGKAEPSNRRPETAEPRAPFSKKLKNLKKINKKMKRLIAETNSLTAMSKLITDYINDTTNPFATEMGEKVLMVIENMRMQKKIVMGVISEKPHEHVGQRTVLRKQPSRYIALV